MHSLAGTFVKELQEEVLPNLGLSLYPLKIILLPTMSRILYFRSKEQAEQWHKAIAESIGQSDIGEFYKI